MLQEIQATTFGTQRGAEPHFICSNFFFVFHNCWNCNSNKPPIHFRSSIDISPSESFLRGGKKPTLNVDSAGHALHVFINGQFLGIFVDLLSDWNFDICFLSHMIKFTGSAFGTRKDRGFTFMGPVNLHAGTNHIALVSVAVGLPVSCYFTIFNSMHVELSDTNLWSCWRMLDCILRHGKRES